MLHDHHRSANQGFKVRPCYLGPCLAEPPLTYLRCMKAKDRTKRTSRLNALISVHLKRRLQRLSKAEDRSMSAILEDLLETNLPEDPDLKTGPGKGDAWVKANRGILKGKFTKKDYERDDLQVPARLLGRS